MKKILLTSLSLILFLAVALTSCTHENVRNGRVIRNAVTDIDGNHYDAVKIGNQVWMQSNLRTTRFRDGSAIPQGSDGSCTDPNYYQSPTYDEKTYGFYYNWAAVDDASDLCPKGWHVPTDAEWTELEEYVGSKSEYVYGSDPQNIAKALASNEGWSECRALGTPGCEPDKNNATGFSAVPAGLCLGYYCTISCFGYEASFWSSTEESSGYSVYCCNISDNHANVIVGPINEFVGCSVRCVRDNKNDNN